MTAKPEIEPNMNKALAAAEGIIKALKLYCWDGAEYVLKRDAIAAEILKHLPEKHQQPSGLLWQLQTISKQSVSDAEFAHRIRELIYQITEGTLVTVEQEKQP